MIFLLLNVIFASAFMLTIKWVQIRRHEDVVSVGALNYIIAAILLTPEFFQITPEQVTSGAMWTGGIMGGCYFIAYFFVIYAIKYIGASSSTVIAVLSILLPITCGVFVWGERPNTFQVLGIVLALLSLLLIGGNSKNKLSDSGSSDSGSSDGGSSDGESNVDVSNNNELLEQSKIDNVLVEQTNQPSESMPGLPTNSHASWVMPVVLVIFFLLAGCSRLAQEAFKHVTGPETRPTFLFTAFVVAAIPSIILLVVRRRKISLVEFAFGGLMGLANALQTHFILLSLNHFNGFVVFPVTSAGGLILTTLVATRLLGEKLNFRTYLGITIACVALVLLHWLPGN